MCETCSDAGPASPTRRAVVRGAGGLGLGLALGGAGLVGGVLGAAPALAAPDPRLLTAEPAVRPRSAWAGPDRPPRRPLAVEAPGDVRFLLVHHTASPGNGYAEGAVPGLLRGMYDTHTGTKGWPDLAYNFLVDRYGGIWEGRAGSLAGPVQPDATGGSQGFAQLGCFLGDHTTVAPTPQAEASMTSLLAWLARRYGVDTRPGATAAFVSRGSNRHPAGTRVVTRTVEGHRAMSQTTCPGDAAYALVRDRLPAAVTQLAASTDPIARKHQAYGGAAVLGAPTSGQYPTARGGTAQDFERGRIYTSPATGTWVVVGAVLGAFLAQGGVAGPIGLPLTDELPTGDGRGRYNDFSGGATVVWSPETGAHAVLGAIRGCWNALGSQAGRLGYPTTSELPTGDGRGRYNDFAGRDGEGPATVVHSPTTGSRAVFGAVKQTWNRLGSQAGPLGYPSTDERPTPDGRGRYQDFAGGTGGTVVWSPETGARAVYGAIKVVWNRLGSQAGPLGYPTTDEQDAPGGTGRRNAFQGGAVHWSPATGAVSVHGAFHAAWAARGADGGALRLPVAEARDDGPGRQRQDFQGGALLRDTRTGAVTAVPR